MMIDDQAPPPPHPAPRTPHPPGPGLPTLPGSLSVNTLMIWLRITSLVLGGVGLLNVT